MAPFPVTFALVCFLTVACVLNGTYGRVKKDLVLAGIFPVRGSGGWAGGEACLPAALMALDKINKDSIILPDYNLVLHWNDSECQPGKGITLLYELLYNPPQKIMLLGPGCSTVTTTIAEAAKMWNLIVMSYGSSSPALSDRKRFATFFRTHPSANLNNPAYIQLFRRFEWKRINILQEVEEVFVSNVEDLERLCKEANIEIVSRQSFVKDSVEAVKNLKRSDARIIVGLFYELPARNVFCEAFKQKLYGPRVVWLIIGWYADNWFQVVDPAINCTAAELQEALEGHLTAESLIKNMNTNNTLSGLTTKQFFEDLRPNLIYNPSMISPEHAGGYVESPLAYDAVWAIAKAFNLTITALAKQGKRLEDFTYSDKDTADILHSAMTNTSFEGVSGPVNFTSKGDRVTETLLEQMQNGSYKTLGYYDPYKNAIRLEDGFKERWIGPKRPKDQTEKVDEIRTLDNFLFCSMVSLAALGIVAAIACLVFNITHRMRRLIQMSHPNINNLMLVGIIFCLMTVFLMGLGSDTGKGMGSIVPKHLYPSLCQAQAWILMTGFTLSYGSMFAKIWNVHRLSTSAKKESKREARKSAGRGSFRNTTFSEIRTFSSLVQTQKVASWQLYSVVGFLLAIDVLILTLWATIDPMFEKPLPLPDEATLTEDDRRFVPQLEQCVSHNGKTWMGVIFAYKGLFLIFGLFLAYETRSVKIKELNDSRFVGMSMYNVVVLCIITAPVTLIINKQHNAKFAFVALSIMFCCFLSMGVIFVPKVLEIYRRKNGEHHDSKKLDDSVPSREEEEKHQKLLAENEELKKQIQEKEEKVKILNERVRQRAAERARMTKEQEALKNEGSPKQTATQHVSGDRHSDSALPSSTDDPSAINSIQEL